MDEDATPLVITIGTTQRGFNKMEFKDRYGNECSIQKSSLATEDAIWFGIDTNFDGAHVNERMHLTQDMVAQLLPILAHFAENGELPHPPSS